MLCRPAAVAAAIRVIEVQEQLQIPISSVSCRSSPALQFLQLPYPYMDDILLADGERALLRQMCNVRLFIIT